MKLTSDSKKKVELTEKLKEVAEQYDKDKSLWEKRISEAEESLKLRKKKYDCID